MRRPWAVTASAVSLTHAYFRTHDEWIDCCSPGAYLPRGMRRPMWSGWATEGRIGFELAVTNEGRVGLASNWLSGHPVRVCALKQCGSYERGAKETVDTDSSYCPEHSLVPCNRCILSGC